MDTNLSAVGTMSDYRPDYGFDYKWGSLGKDADADQKCNETTERYSPLPLTQPFDDSIDGLTEDDAKGKKVAPVESEYSNDSDVKVVKVVPAKKATHAKGTVGGWRRKENSHMRNSGMKRTLMGDVIKSIKQRNEKRLAVVKKEKV